MIRPDFNEQSFTAEGAKGAKEQKSLTAKVAEDAKENNSLTAKHAKAAKESIIRPKPQGRQDNAKPGIWITDWS